MVVQSRNALGKLEFVPEWAVLTLEYIYPPVALCRLREILNQND